MNGKLIVGILALAGIGACICYYFCKRKPTKRTPQNQNTENLPKSVITSSDKAADIVENAKEKFFEDKRDAAVSIKKRHEEAANEMKDALNHIFDNESVAETENTGTLNEMLDDFDKLMD